MIEFETDLLLNVEMQLLSLGHYEKCQPRLQESNLRHPD